MKRYIKSAEDFEPSYQLEPLDSDDNPAVDDILDELKVRIQKKFGKKYKKLSVESDDLM